MMDARAAGDAVVIEHHFDAPVEMIWKMWTDPNHFRAWYGPEGALIPVVRMDVRVGGARLVCMEVQTPNGPMEMWFAGEYVEVLENQRLVYTEYMSDEDGVVRSPADMGMPEGHPTTTQIEVVMSADGDGTRMVLTHTGIPDDSPGATGWRIAIAKLTDYLKACS